MPYILDFRAKTLLIYIKLYLIDLPERCCRNRSKQTHLSKNPKIRHDLAMQTRTEGMTRQTEDVMKNVRKGKGRLKMSLCIKKRKRKNNSKTKTNGWSCYL